MPLGGMAGKALLREAFVYGRFRYPDKQRNPFSVFTLVNVSPSQSAPIFPSEDAVDSSQASLSKPSGHAPLDHALSNHDPSDHVHTEESLRKIVNRLSRLEGHIRGVKTMVQENRPCPDVLIQVAAVRGGLDKVARLILDEHLSQCISRAVEEGNIDVEVEALKKALDRFIS